MKKDKQEPIDPEVMDLEEVEQKTTLPKKKERHVPEVASKPAAFPFLNRFERKRVESFTEVVRAETDLMDALGAHTRTRAKLRDIDVEIETERLERRIKLGEAQREDMTGPQKDRLAKLRLEVEEAELEERLKRLKNPLPEAKDEIEGLRKRLADSRRKAEVEFEHEIEKVKAGIKNKAKTRQEVMVLRQEILDNFLQNRDPAGLKGMEKVYYENLLNTFDDILSDF